MNQRRSFLKSSVVLASAIGLPALAKAAQPAPAERTLRLYNTHTGESLRSVFWAEGQFIPDALKDINKLLRDHRNDKVADMDPKLILLLNDVSDKFGDGQTLHIISGYRSPESNARLREQGVPAARQSLHLVGKAADIRIANLNEEVLGGLIKSFRGGGVGYYYRSGPRGGWIHADTGLARTWKG